MQFQEASDNRAGFTLVEILVSIALAGIVMASIYSAYYSQQKSYIVQEQVVAAQQNLRAAMYYMEREIRMAGYKRAEDESFIAINNDSTAEMIRFQKYDSPGGTLEDISYELSERDLRRVTGGATQTIAQNIDVLNFVYLDADGDPTANMGEARSVQVTLVARNERTDPQYTNTVTYRNMQGDSIFVSPSDHFRREVLSAQVKCRNLGLE